MTAPAPLPLRIARIAWGLVVFGAIAVAAIVLPTRLTFGLSRFEPLTTLYEGAKLIFVLDFLVSIALFAPRPKTPRSAITLATDLIGALPWGALLGAPAWELLRLLKLHKVPSLIPIQRHNDVLTSTFLRLSLFLFWFVLSVHWLTCGWLLLQQPPPRGDLAHAYLRAMYWCITTLTTVGYGDVTPRTTAQTIYTMIAMLLGVGVYGYVIGNIANLLSKIDMVRASYIAKIDRLSGFLRYRKVPLPLQQRIYDYYTYLWENRMGYDESMVLSDLPPSLQEELSLILKHDFISKVPFLQEASTELIRALSMKLRPVVFTPGDIIFQTGDHGRHMYFIGHGAVEVVSGDGSTIHETLHAGDFFGEIALLHDRPRYATVRATDYSDLYLLDKEAFDHVIARYPDFAAHVSEVAASHWQRGRSVIRVRYHDLNKTLLLDDPSHTLLDLSVQHQIPHLRECGGNGRCTTCRVQIIDGLQHVSPRTHAEAKLAKERGWDPSTRLACQTHPTGHITIRRLLQSPDEISTLQSETIDSHVGQQQQLAILLADLHHILPLLQSQTPHDSIHLLNQFFASLAEPALMNNGLLLPHGPTGFVGIFGINDPHHKQSCLSAVRAGMGMLHAAKQFCQDVSYDPRPDASISIHFGPCTLGRIGPPNQKQLSLFGPALELTERIQQHNEAIGTKILLSQDTLALLNQDNLSLGPPILLQHHHEHKQVFELRKLHDDPTFLLQHSYVQLQPIQNTFAQHFTLAFHADADDPSAQDTLHEEQRHLLQTTREVIYSFSRPKHMRIRQKQLLQQQHDPQQQERAQDALRSALKETLQQSFTPEVEAAWQDATPYILQRTLEHLLHQEIPPTPTPNTKDHRPTEATETPNTPEPSQPNRDS